MNSPHALSLGFLLTAALAGCRLTNQDGPVPQELLTSRHYSQQGVAAMEQADWQQAEGMLLKAVRACPQDAEARRHYAEALWHRGARREAIQQMAEAVRIAGDDPTLFVRLAQMRLENGDATAAHVEVEHALALDPKSSTAWSTRGRVMQASGNLHQALADFHRALGYAPEDRDVLLEIAELHRQLNEPTRALVSLQSLADTYAVGEEPQQLCYLMGLAYSALGRNDDAVESFSTAVSRGPATAELLAQLGEAQRRCGRLQEAAAAAREALALDPRYQPGLELNARIETAQRAAATSMR